MSLQSLLHDLPSDFNLQDWQPTRTTHMDLTIKANGEWWHEGTQIKKTRLIDLFSKLLWQEDGEFYLKTPHEKVRIQVEDAPFLMIEIEQDQQTLYAKTLQNKWIKLDAHHPMMMKNDQPYVEVRDGLLGLLSRSAFFQLIEYGKLEETPTGDTVLTLQSGDFCWQLKA